MNGMELAPGIVLKERYRILRKLGQGGMGAVFLAHDQSLDHEVALKVNQSRAEESSNQFLREARLLAGLRHPNLPRVTDFFILDSAQYLVMDYIPGEDLDSLLKSQGRQPLARILAWAKQLGGALAYMHSQDPPVVHRDIKPSNIKLSAGGEAVLVDFGIARLAAPDQATAPAVRGYTPGFAPPEQYGDGRAGPQADQYALAATLYTLLSGQKPAEAIRRVLGQADLTPLNALAPEISAEVNEVFERALAIRPEQRFPGVEAFVSALGAASPAAFTPPVQPGLPEGPAGLPEGPAGLPEGPKALPPQAARATRRPGWILWAAIAGGLFILFALVLLAARGLTFFQTAASAIPSSSLTAAQALQPSPAPSRTLEPASPTPADTASPLPPTAVPTLQASATPLSPAVVPPPLGKGGLIAFASNRADGKTFQIWTLRAWLNDQGQVMTSPPEQLTSSEGSKRQPSWSPDGSELLYVAPGGSGQGLDIWKMKADGSQPPVDLTRRRGDETDPAWSPDGKLIAFTENDRGDSTLQVYLMNADGSNLYKLSYDQDESKPTWSPKMDWLGFVMNVAGNRIFYVRAPSDPAASTPEPPYYVTPAAFDRFDLRGNLGQVAEPAWSPDGEWIAYTRLKTGAVRIFLARNPLKVVDQDIIPLTSGVQDTSPAWSPDSQWLAFVSYRDGQPEIYVMRSTGKSQSRLTDDPGQDLDPAWQPLPAPQP